MTWQTAFLQELRFTYIFCYFLNFVSLFFIIESKIYYMDQSLISNKLCCRNNNLILYMFLNILIKKIKW